MLRVDVNALKTALPITGALQCLMLLAVSTAIFADGGQPEASRGGAIAGESAVTLPVVSFRADPSGDDLFDALRSGAAFARLSKEAPGSPIELRVYHTGRPAKMDAKNFFSGLASVGTLGLSPVIMSGEYTMHYEIYLNGQRISRYECSTKLSRSESTHGNAPDPTHGLGPEGVVWAKSTVDLFLKDIARDEPIRALAVEYQTYFGTPAPVERTVVSAP